MKTGNDFIFKMTNSVTTRRINIDNYTVYRAVTEIFKKNTLFQNENEAKSAFKNIQALMTLKLPTTTKISSNQHTSGILLSHHASEFSVPPAPLLLGSPQYGKRQ